MCGLFLGAWEWIGLGLLGVAYWCLLSALVGAWCPDGISAQNKRFPCPTLRLTLIQSAAQTTTSSSVSPPRPPAPSPSHSSSRSFFIFPLALASDVSWRAAMLNAYCSPAACLND
ncbi:hypothetical protein IWX91DRAFT_200756 [Phyllosticta citricarpa]